jgi:hypothetical protein
MVPFESMNKNEALPQKRGVYMSGMKEMRKKMRGSIVGIKDYTSSQGVEIEEERKTQFNNSSDDSNMLRKP